jgi:polyhydroxyalkanoate synthesis regulator phasin
MNKNIRRAMLAGLGALTLTEQLSKKILVELVKRGAVSEKDAKNMINGVIKEAVKTKKKIEVRAEAEVRKMIKKLDLATMTDLRDLESKFKKKGRK